MANKDKGGKVDAEQFRELKEGLNRISYGHTSIEREVLNLRGDFKGLEKDVANLKESTKNEINLLKYGITALIALGLLKSCDGYNPQHIQQLYQQPPAQVYIINTPDKTGERLKALEEAYKQIGEAIKQMDKNKEQ